MDGAIDLIMINMDYMPIKFTYTTQAQQVTTQTDSNRHRQSETLYLPPRGYPSARRWGFWRTTDLLDKQTCLNDIN